MTTGLVERTHLDATDSAADAILEGDELLSHLSDLDPGPLAMVVLTGIEPMLLDEFGRVEYARQWERQLAWVTAQEQASLAAVMLADPPPRASQVIADDELRRQLVAATLKWAPATAGARLELARRLVTELPATQAMLAAGQISFRHAVVLADAIVGLDPATVALVEAHVLTRAPEQTVSAFRRCVRRAVIAAAPEIAQIKHAQAAADRHVRRYPLEDGMSCFSATMSAANVELVYLAVDAVARKMAAADRGADGSGGDGLSMDARRADALLAWALVALADPNLPKRHGRPVELRFTCDRDSMLGLADHPAELHGYGFVPASVARALSADAKWRRFITEPVTGHLLDCGTTVYRPPQVLLDFLVARDDTCRFPGCSMAAERCDIDHVCPHAKGGRTSACNCVCLCRRHHLLKTFGGWLLECHGNGDVTWTAPTGQRFFVPARSHDPTIW